jgi:predicted TIM-barrel fold metal-dependent hydrolase
MSESTSGYIDFHGHQGRWDIVGLRDDPAQMLAAMDSVGIERACLFNIFHPDSRMGHDRLHQFVRLHPTRFIGFAYCTPMLQRDRMLRELERAIDQLGFAAIKIYPLYGEIAMNDPRWDPVYQFAHDRGLAIIAHTGSQPSVEPRLVMDVAPRFPRANFVLAHAGNLPAQRLQAIAAARTFANVYIETCTTFRSPGVIEQLVEGVGAEKVIYGSDMPLMDPRCQIGRIITARLLDADKQLILRENARRLLRLS